MLNNIAHSSWRWLKYCCGISEFDNCLLTILNNCPQDSIEDLQAVEKSSRWCTSREESKRDVKVFRQFVFLWQSLVLVLLRWSKLATPLKSIFAALQISGLISARNHLCCWLNNSHIEKATSCHGAQITGDLHQMNQYCLILSYLTPHVLPVSPAWKFPEVLHNNSGGSPFNNLKDQRKLLWRCYQDDIFRHLNVAIIHRARIGIHGHCFGFFNPWKCWGHILTLCLLSDCDTASQVRR